MKADVIKPPFQLPKLHDQCSLYCLGTLPDDTHIGAWIHEKRFFVEVTGINESIAEIGEQLAWLASALRSSLHRSKLSYCRPYISSTAAEKVSSSMLQLPSIIKVSCVIDFSLNVEEENLLPSRGRCWHQLFRNPIAVKGFPIPHRSRHETGLEIPLNLLAGLVHAENADIFDNKIFIKGFSSLLVPTKYMRDQGQIIWHLFYNPSGDRISYRDGMKGHVANVTLPDLGTSRHILGWCLDARCYAGMP